MLLSSSSNRGSTECYRRKIKCDRQSPCFQCFKANLSCTLPSAQRPSSTQEKNGQDSILLERLQRLERTVEFLQNGGSQNVQVPTGAENTISSTGHWSISSRQALGDAQLKPGNLNTSTSLFEKDVSRLLLNEGRSRYVSDRFWASFIEEVSRPSCLASSMSLIPSLD